MDARVQAVRSHELVGRGSCTTVDECLTDLELLDWLNEDDIKSIEEAVKWAIDFESLHLEQALNARWGEDDDPQLKTWNEWQKKIG